MGKPSILMQCKQSIFQSCLLRGFCGKRLHTETIVSVERDFQVYLGLNTEEYLQVFVTSLVSKEYGMKKLQQLCSCFQVLVHEDVVSVFKCLKHNEQLPPSVHLVFIGQLLQASVEFEEIRGSYGTNSSVKFLNSNKQGLNVSIVYREQNQEGTCRC